MMAFLAPPSLALTISRVEVSKITSSSAQISWLTDEPSSGRVRFGTTASLGFSAVQTEQRANHSILLLQLDTDTAYFFEAVSQTGAGEAIDDNNGAKYTFRTLDTIPPQKVQNVRILSKTTDSLAITWDPSSAADLRHYAVYVNGVFLGNVSSAVLPPAFNHTSVIEGESYSYKVRAVDTSGNEGGFSDLFTTSTDKADTTPPKISGLDLRNASDTQLVIAFQTDENTTADIRYGEKALSTLQADDAFSASHAFTLSDLRKNITYMYRVTACDAAHNCDNVSSAFVAGKDAQPPFINVTLPRYSNRVSLDITGTTEPFSEVSLFLNNLNIPIRVLNSDVTGARGNIAFKGILLKKDNIIKITARDKAGNLNQRLYEVSVDTDEPVVALKGIPAVTPLKNLTIMGQVNEPAFVRVFVRSTSQKETQPRNVTGLRNVSIAENAVSLAWNQAQDTDFSHYIVRRGDVGPIAVLHPSTSTAYTDTVVDSGKQYTYAVSYMNKFGKEGKQSDPLTIRLPSGGLATGIKPGIVSINQDFREPDAQANTSGDFALSVLLDDDDTYEVKVEITDRAGNAVTKATSVQLDTKEPEIRIVSPPNNALVFENYATEVTIQGKTEPGARVHLYVGRTPFNDQNTTFDLTALKKDIKDTPEKDLNADCQAVIRTRYTCGTNADYSTTADGQGVFTFTKIDASLLGNSPGIREVSPSAFSTSTALTQSRTSKLIFIATDRAGLRNVIENGLTVGTCWSGNLSWDVIPLTEFQSPTFLSTERLAENSESIYFYFNYSYIGPGTARTAKIKSVSLTKACGNKEVLDPRFNISCQILPSGAQAVRVNPEGTVSYSAVRLNRITGMEKWLSDDWKGFFNAVRSEMVFPFKVTITYDHEVEGRKQTEVQSTCQEVAFVMDKSRIDPRAVLPDWLLYDFVGLLNQSLSTIRQVQEQIDAIMPYVAMGCLGSYGANFAAQVWRRWMEFSIGRELRVDKGTKKITDAAMNAFFPIPPGATSGKGPYCQNLANSFQGSKAYGNTFKLDYLSDADLQECFPEIWSAWKAEENTYKAYRYACDRLFGHSSPSRWTETMNDAQLEQKVSLGKACATDLSVAGAHLRAVKCTDAAASPSYSTTFNKPNFMPDDRCLEVTTTTGSAGRKSLYVIRNLEDPGSGLYRIEHSLGVTLAANFQYAVQAQGSDTDYIVPQQKTCNEVCGGTKTGSTSYKFNPGTNTIEVSSSKLNEVGGLCIKAEDCVSFNQQANKNSNEKKLTYKYTGSGSNAQNNAFVVKSAQRKGYTSDCFYGASGVPASEGISVISNNPKERYECCCIKGNVQDTPQYYTGTDTYLGNTPDYVTDSQIATNHQFVHKKSGATEAASPAPSPAASSAASSAPPPITSTPPPPKTPAISPETEPYVPIQWSYRYWKIRFRALASDGKTVHNAYNPNRYVSERDFPACFGQNSWLDSTQTLVIMDSNRQHLSTLQCANIGGIQQRLTLISNLLSAMQTCLIQVRTTGKADTGACKELFTQYVCSFTWDVIQLIQNGFNGCGGMLSDFSSSEDDPDVLALLKGGLGSVTSTLKDKQNEFLKEYGNAKLNEMFGGGAEAIAKKICLAAFGYDWPFSVKNFIDASYAQPFATLVQGITGSREYLSVDPKNRQATYEYRTSWLINPGCDFANYKVELACISRDTLNSGLGADCTKQASPDGINCPCLESGEKLLAFFTDNKLLKQNQLVDRDFHKVITSTFRYDHYKITLRPDAKIDKSIKSRCFPSGYDGGVFYYPITDRTAHDIAACHIDPLSGVYLCESGLDFFSRKGFAYFNAVRINGQPAETVRELASGQPLNLEADIFKAGGNKCFVARITSPIGRPAVAQPVTIEGTSTTTLQLADKLNVQAIPQLQQAPADSGIIALLEASDTLATLTFSVTFNDADKNGQLSSQDTMTVTANTGTGSSVTTDLNANEAASSDGLVRVSVSAGTNPQVTISLNGGGTRIRVTAVNFNQVVGQQRTSISTSFTIAPSQAATPAFSQQTLILSIGLYNVREGSEASIAFNPNTDCNINDPSTNSQGDQQVRTYTVSLVSSLTAGSAFTPTLFAPTIQPPQATVGTILDASARVARKDNLNTAITGAELVIDDNYLRIPMQKTQSIDDITDIYGVKIMNNIGLASGTHTASVEVAYQVSNSAAIQKATSGKTSFTLTPNPNPVEIPIQAGP
ncbi:hypothetical protein J4435_02220 [Candidatus Woesearchaeota archaeon]|nr:hypothetical protein [Candidatus Woesearchaeota archaeon]